MTQTRTWLFWLGVGAAFLWFLFSIKAILLPFVVGMGVAYFLDPAADKLEKLGCSRSVATTIITLSFFAIIVLLFVTLLPVLYHQAAGLFAAMPGYIADLRTSFAPQIDKVMQWFNGVESTEPTPAIADISSILTSRLAQISSGLLQSSFAIVNIISLFVIMPVVSFYLLRDWDRLTAKIDALLPLQYADVIREQIDAIDETLSGFVRGTINVMLILGTFYAISLSVIGLHFAIFIGLLGGVMIIIPYLGTIISGAAAVGMAYLQFDAPASIIAVLVIFIIGQMLEGYVLTPKLVGDKVGLHPLWLIFGMLAGATLFGFVGIFIAVPVTAVIGVLVRFATLQYKASDYYKGEAK